MYQFLGLLLGECPKENNFFSTDPFSNVVSQGAMGKMYLGNYVQIPVPLPVFVTLLFLLLVPMPAQV